MAAFALFEDRLFSRLDNPLILTAILLWLFGVVLWSSLSVVRHAESLARRLGEPYGTLLLTLTITSIEVVAISAVVRHGGSNPTLMRDTLLALIMIIMNGMVGVTLLIGGLKHREQTFNLQGANAYLSVLLPLATFALIMPRLHADDPGPNLFGRPAIRPGDRVARPLPPLSRSADRALSRLLRGRRPHGCGGARG